MSAGSWILWSAFIARTRSSRRASTISILAGTVYGRVGALVGSDSMVGFALDALREAYFAPEATGRLLLVGYRTLTTEPACALEAI